MSLPEGTGTLITAAFGLYAEECGEPTDDTYRRFFARHPDAKEIFGGDDRAEGRMMWQMLEILSGVADGKMTADNSAYWVSDHMAMEVEEEMIFDLFDALRTTLAEGLGSRWTPETDVAWNQLIAAMAPSIRREIAEY